MFGISDVTASVLALLAAIHVYWAAAGRATSAVVPERDGKPLFRPGRSATLVVAVLLSVAASIPLGEVRVWGTGVPHVVFDVGSWGLAAVFLARAVGDFRYVGFFKRVRGTRFARRDSWIYSPLALAIAVGCASGAVHA